MEKTMIPEEDPLMVGVDIDIMRELSEIEADDFCIDFGRILPGEEVVSEFTEFEKRVVVWHLLAAEEMEKTLWAINRKYLISENDEEGLLNIVQFEILQAYSKKMETAFGDSLSARFSQLGKPILFRGNFQIVTSSRKMEDLLAELNYQNLFFVQWVFRFLGRAEKEGTYPSC